MPTILVAEDDPDVSEIIADALRAEGFDVEAFADGPGLLARVRSAVHRQAPRVDLIVSDVRMPGLTGTEVLARARALGFDVPFVMMTAFGSRELRDGALSLGAARVFDKPFDIDDLCAVARDLLLQRPPGAVDVA